MNSIGAAQSMTLRQETRGLNQNFRHVDDEIVGPVLIKIVHHGPLIGSRETLLPALSR